TRGEGRAPPRPRQARIRPRLHALRSAEGTGPAVRIVLLMATGREAAMAIKGSCHCGATQFEVDAAPSKVIRCTCSFCAKRGALWGYCEPAQFRLKTARDRVSTYQWRSYTAQHHHCA